MLQFLPQLKPSILTGAGLCPNFIPHPPPPFLRAEEEERGDGGGGDLKPCLVVTHRKMEVMNPSGRSDGFERVKSGGRIEEPTDSTGLGTNDAV
nr:hypothetical protein TorRG33x02_097500 [Ipomoea batatas]